MLRFLAERLLSLDNKDESNKELVRKTKRALIHLIFSGSFDGADVFLDEIKTHKSQSLESHPKINENVRIQFGIRKTVANASEAALIVAALRIAAQKFTPEMKSIFPTPFDEMLSIFPRVSSERDFDEKLQVISTLAEKPSNVTHQFMCFVIYWLFDNALWSARDFVVPRCVNHLLITTRRRTLWSMSISKKLE